MNTDRKKVLARRCVSTFGAWHLFSLRSPKGKCGENEKDIVILSSTGGKTDVASVKKERFFELF